MINSEKFAKSKNMSIELWVDLSQNPVRLNVDASQKCMLYIDKKLRTITCFLDTATFWKYKIESPTITVKTKENALAVTKVKRKTKPSMQITKVKGFERTYTTVSRTDAFESQTKINLRIFAEQVNDDDACVTGSLVKLI